jgi:probable selenium-dependent hydroxylase accessory protein YqeC
MYILTLEPDCSEKMPFKAPADHEPALPPSATLVVGVVGADIFGRALSPESVHRPERVSAITGASLGDPITPALVAAVMASGNGGRKSVPAGARYAVLINKVTERRLAPARETGRLLLAGGVDLVVLARVRDTPPVVEVHGARPL